MLAVTDPVLLAWEAKKIGHFSTESGHSRSPLPRWRRLGALSVGILALSLSRFARLVRQQLARLLTAFARGVSVVELAP